ncbi:MAG: phosphatase PAP2 family protein [Clostridia bacterium]|nr:phosphatase PAP2 family protein [Clostridia bacterium]
MKKKTAFALAILFALLFAALIILVKTVDVAKIGPCGTEVGFSTLNGGVRDEVGHNSAFEKISKYIGYAAILAVAACAVLAVVQLIRRKSILKIDGELLSLGGIFAITAGLYALFEVAVVNYRPILEEGQSFPEASFPSSHAMLSAVVFICAAVFVHRNLLQKKPVARNIIVFILALLGILGVVTRFISGVHWISDILGGVFVSLALIFLYCGIIRHLSGRRD